MRKSLRFSRGGEIHTVPVCAIVGDAQDEGLDAAYERGLTSVITINRMAIPFSQAKLRAKDDLRQTVKNVIRLIASQTSKK